MNLLRMTSMAALVLSLLPAPPAAAAAESAGPDPQAGSGYRRSGAVRDYACHQGFLR